MTVREDTRAQKNRHYEGRPSERDIFLGLDSCQNKCKNPLLFGQVVVKKSKVSIPKNAVLSITPYTNLLIINSIPIIIYN